MFPARWMILPCSSRCPNRPVGCQPIRIIELMVASSGCTIVMTKTVTVTKMIRVFQFNGIRLPDPNPEMSVDNVKALYSAQYPELTTAVVNGPEAVGDKLRYTFDRAIGSKG